MLGPTFLKGAKYYIAPADGSSNQTCTTMTPCHTLSQLDIASLQGTSTSITLLFLPGIHAVPVTIAAYNISRLKVTPLDPSLEVTVYCEEGASFLFEDVRELVIASLRFTSCSLKMVEVLPQFDNSDTLAITRNNFTAEITNCAFTEVDNTYAIILFRMGYVLIKNCSVTHCNGAIFCNQLKGNAITRLDLIDSLLQNNQRNDEKGGALYLECVVFKMINNKFVTNKALFGGAIYTTYSNVSAYNTLFIDNFSLRSGGAIYFEFTAVFMQNCRFHQNLAKVSGGAIYIQLIFPSVTAYFLDTTFTFNKAESNGGALYCNNHVDLEVVMNGGYSESNLASNGAWFCFSCQLPLSDGS